jgi:hypothetical protein
LSGKLNEKATLTTEFGRRVSVERDGEIYIAIEDVDDEDSSILAALNLQELKWLRMVIDGFISDEEPTVEDWY